MKFGQSDKKNSLQNLFLIAGVLLILCSSSAKCDNSYSSSVVLNKCLYNELGRLERLPLLTGKNETTSFLVQPMCPSRQPHCLRLCQTRVLIRRLEVESVHLTRNGFLRHESHFYSPEDFCVFSLTRKWLTVEICNHDCGSAVCVSKCCPVNKVLDFGSGGGRCVSSQAPWSPPGVFQTEELQVCGESRSNIRFHYFQPLLNCSSQHLFFRKSFSNQDQNQFRVKFRLLLNGSVIVRELLSKEWRSPGLNQFCLDGVQDLELDGKPLDQVLIICASDEEEDMGNGRPGNNDDSSAVYFTGNMPLTGLLYTILLFSGTPFLLMTVVVYILLWSKQNVHGWTIFSHTLAILLNYLGQGVANTVTRLYNSSDNGTTSCVLIGIANHYFTLSAFCWLTMINYDLWSMFRSLKSPVGRSKGMKRFMAYMCFGWGVPFVAVLISVILDLKWGLYGDDGGECAMEVPVPLYGHKTCYIAEVSRSYYLFYPIYALMTINVLFATLTVWNMIVHNKSAKLLKKTTKHKRKFMVWIKLFVVMGVALTSEVVVWSLKKPNETLPWYLVFPDVLSLFQAIAIFILFACQPKIVKQLREEYPQLSLLQKVSQLPCYANTVNNNI